MREKCVWMAGKVTEWPSNRGPISKIWQSDGCNGDTVPLAVRQWYNFHSVGCHLGNVGLDGVGKAEVNGLEADQVPSLNGPSPQKGGGSDGGQKRVSQGA
jgi:hypothetical protein